MALSSHKTVAGSDRPLFAALGVPRRGLLLSLLLLVYLLFHIGPSHGQTGILSADEAFKFSAERGTPGTIILHWKIAPGHYLYRTHMTAREMTYGAVLPLNLPPGVQRSDRKCGTSEIYRDEVTIIIVSAERKALMIGYQGCKENGICYPPNAKRVDLTSLSISDGSGVAPPHEDIEGKPALFTRRLTGALRARMSIASFLARRAPNVWLTTCFSSNST